MVDGVEVRDVNKSKELAVPIPDLPIVAAQQQGRSRGAPVAAWPPMQHGGGPPGGHRPPPTTGGRR